MPLTPKAQVRFLAEQFDLMEALCRYSTHSAGEVEEAISEFARGTTITPRSLVDAGFLDHDDARDHYAVASHFKTFLDRLLQRRHHVDASLIEAAVSELEMLRGLLDDMLRSRSWARVADLVASVRTVSTQIDDAAQSNKEAIHRFTEAYRKDPPLSSRECLRRIREVWECYVVPMQAIFVPNGSLDEALTKLLATFDRAEERAPSQVVDDLQWGRFDLRRLRPKSFRAYQDSAREVAPLYEQAKRNAQVAASASALIAHYYQVSKGLAKPVDDTCWDRWFGVMDPWEDRGQRPFGTGDMASWLAQAFYCRPTPAPFVAAPPPGVFRMPLTARVVEKRYRAWGRMTLDLLAWITVEFPEASLREVIRAYHHLLKINDVTRGGERRVLEVPGALITSQPVGGTRRGIA